MAALTASAHVPLPLCLLPRLLPNPPRLPLSPPLILQKVSITGIVVASKQGARASNFVVDDGSGGVVDCLVFGEYGPQIGQRIQLVGRLNFKDGWWEVNVGGWGEVDCKEEMRDFVVGMGALQKLMRGAEGMGIVVDGGWWDEDAAGKEVEESDNQVDSQVDNETDKHVDNQVDDSVDNNEESCVQHESLTPHDMMEQSEDESDDQYEELDELDSDDSDSPNLLPCGCSPDDLTVQILTSTHAFPPYCPRHSNSSLPIPHLDPTGQFRTSLFYLIATSTAPLSQDDIMNNPLIQKQAIAAVKRHAKRSRGDFPPVSGGGDDRCKFLVRQSLLLAIRDGFVVESGGGYKATRVDS